jgi:hypothetical protein
MSFEAEMADGNDSSTGADMDQLKHLVGSNASSSIVAACAVARSCSAITNGAFIKPNAKVNRRRRP